MSTHRNRHWQPVTNTESRNGDSNTKECKEGTLLRESAAKKALINIWELKQ